MKNEENDPEYRLEVISDSPTFYLLIEKFVKLSYSNIQLQVWDSLPMIHESLNKQPSDLIILDGNFTQNSAIDLIYSIRFKLKIFTPIWFFSVIETPEYLLKALEVGANRIIERPFDPIEIASEIHQYLKQKNVIDQS
ncbi:MAG: response regulator transcription factor [Paludibacteraceae bacterium]|jgi:DNA-binding response OmpR family regulator|nr:response regulator transcription factor [Paludibacteraceae bacterium]